MKRAERRRVKFSENVRVACLRLLPDDDARVGHIRGHSYQVRSCYEEEALLLRGQTGGATVFIFVTRKTSSMNL